MNTLQFQGISKNLRYVFTNRGIYDFVNEKSYLYESMTIFDGIDILKNVQEFEYKVGKISLSEHLSNPRKALYNLSNILSPKSSIKMIREWEENFGSKLLLLNESVDKILIENKVNDAWNGVKLILSEDKDSWYNPANWGGYIAKGASNLVDYGKEKIKQGTEWAKEQGRQIKQKGILGYAKDKASAAWDWIKEKATAAWNCLKNNFVECLMEGLRSAMYSLVGIAVETFLAVTGIAAPIPMILWGLMLVWDVYKMLSGKYDGGEYEWSWFDIVFDILGVVTAGPGAIAAKKTVGAFAKGFKGVGLKGILTKLSSKGGVVGAWVKGLTKILGKGISAVLGAVKKGTEWISKNFGIKFLDNFVGKAKSYADEVVKAVSEVAPATIVAPGAKVASKPVSKELLKKGAVAGLGAAGLGVGITAVAGGADAAKGDEGGVSDENNLQDVETLTSAGADYGEFT